MLVNLKTKFNWFLGLFFKNKEYEFEVPICEATKKQAKIMRKNFDTQDMPVSGDEYKALRSDIRVSRRHKLGGGGICCYCGKYQPNVAWHEARCPQRTTLAGRIRG